MPDPSIQLQYLEKFVIPLIAKAGLKVKVTRKPEYTTLKITVKRDVSPR